jgi:ferric-dicitrate binding protein FerR (iron transport regulator)
MTDEERETAELLRLLKATPSPEARERAFAKLSREFTAIQANKAAAPAARAKRPPWLAAIAAGIVAVAGGIWTWQTANPTLVARVEAIEGAPAVRGNWFMSGYEAVSVGDSVAAGNLLRVDAGKGLLLRCSADLTVRFGEDTVARIVAPGEIQLERGRIFVDATPGADAPLRVVTPHGTVTHLGTQYLVAADAERVEVSVREGRAQVTTGEVTSVAQAGQWVLLRAGDAPVSGEITAADTRFDWIGVLPSQFRLEGATLAEFLAWFQRESGLTPVYNTGVSAEDYAHVRLKGSIEHLAPLDALELVLATADLAWHREGNQVVIEKRAAGA